MKRQITAAFLLSIAFILALTACSLFRDTRPSDTDAINTAAAKTVSVLSTNIAGARTQFPASPAPTTLTATSTPALLATASPTSTSTVNGACINDATFVRDVTIPDGSTIPPDTTFTKTWEIKNTGTCIWNSDYTVIFSGRGSAMGGPAETAILQAGEVKPDQTTRISVRMKAPGEPGDYQGSWKLRAGSGPEFGSGKNTGASLIVKIHVEEAYSFAEQFCSAQWSTSAGDIPCPGKDGDSTGFVLQASSPMLEDRIAREGPTLITMPQPVASGWIKGEFAPVMVPDHSDFRATISCHPDARGCYVRFRVTAQVENGPEETLGEWNEGYEGNVTEAVSDLDKVSGSPTIFRLYVFVNGAPDQSKAVWFNPRIVKN